MDERIPRHIVVEGPIGVGKTTLVESLSQRLKARILLEKFDENPFLPSFYNDQERYAFQTELFFLLSRFRQQEEFLQEDLFRQCTVSDYLFSKCRLFASLTLSSHELNLFEQTYQVLERSIPKPDLIIYLHAPVDVLLKRIAKRGRSYEQNMDASYLEELSRLYSREFSLLKAQSVPVLSIDTTEVDFRSPEKVSHLFELIVLGQQGRVESSYFSEETVAFA